MNTNKKWRWYHSFFWILKEKVKRLYRYLTTHKCLAEGCNRRLELPYKYCSIECYVYVNNKLPGYKGE